MNLPRIFLIATLLMAFGIGASGQEPPKPILVDEFGKLPCDNLLGRIEVFIQEMRVNLQDRALVVTYPENRDSPARTRMVLVRSRFEMAGIDDRLTLLMGGTKDSMETQLWRVPAGAEPPNLDASQIPEPVLNLKKPFVFGYEDENQICPTFVPRKFGELILANPGSKAHLVVRRGDRHSMDSRSFAAQALETLERDAKISKNQIRIFYAKSSYGLTYGEFWFVPAKKE